jgi:hypothetical protein
MTTVQTGALLQIGTVSLSQTTLSSSNPFSDLAGLINDISINDVESYILANMIQGKTVSQLAPMTIGVGSYILDPSINSGHSFGNTVLVNNSALDTPNLALIARAYASEASNDGSFNLDIGTNSSSVAVTGMVEQDPSSNPYISNRIYFDFSENMVDTSNNDVSNNWYAGFGTGTTRNISKAVNSSLYCGPGTNPLTVTYPDFNQSYAVQNGDFGQHFTAPDDAYADTDASGLPTLVTGDASNGWTLNPSSGESYEYEIGTWRFTRNTATIDVNYTTPLTSLPFDLSGLGYSVSSSTNSNMPSSITNTDLSNQFPIQIGTQLYNFDISAVHTDGGYSIDDSSAVTINDDNISNNFDYMAAYFSGPSPAPHEINITNGGLSITGPVTATADELILSTGAETLTSSQSDVSGFVQMVIPAVNDRTINTTSGIFGDVLIAYDASDASYAITQGASSGIGSISESMKNASDVSGTATTILNGYRSGLGYTGYTNESPYLDSSGNTYLDSSANSNAVAFSERSLIVSNPFTVDQPITGVAAYFMAVDGNQTLTVSGELLYKLTQDACGNQYSTSIPTGAQAVQTVTDGSNAQFNTTSIAQNLSLVDLSYINYRTYLRPKTLAELDIVFSDPSYQLILGLTSLVGGLKTFSPTTDCSYVFSQYGNMEMIGTSCFGLNDITNNGLTLANISNPTGPDTYTLNFQYGAGGDPKGTDIITVTPGPGQFKVDDSSANSAALTSFKLHSVQTSKTPTTFQSVFQLPLGNYSNVYIQTPVFSATGIDTSGEQITTSGTSFDITFSREALMSLYGQIQGTTNPSAVFTDISGALGASWVPVSSKSLTDLSLGFISVSAYIPDSIVSTFGEAIEHCRIVGAGTGENNKVNIYVDDNEDYTANVMFGLYNPAYVSQLTSDNPANYSAKRFYIQNVADISGTMFLDPSFDPADLSIDDFSMYPELSSAGLTVALIPGSPIQIQITDASINRVFTVRMPSIITTDFHIWYCPQDIYNVSYVIDSIFDDYYVQNDNTNNVLTINDGTLTGIAIQDPSALPQDSISFLIKSQNVSLAMIGNSASDSGDLNVIGLGPFSSAGTRSIEFPYYRGYPMTSGASRTSSETQRYTINRTSASATFDISGVAYKSVAKLGTDITDVDISGTYGSFGLTMSFYESMLADDEQMSFPVTILGDTVTISSSDPSYNGSSNTMDNYVLLNYPTGKILSGRVRAYDTESWSVSRGVQNTDIAYSSGYYGVPSGQSFSIDTNIDDSNLVDYQLTPSVRVTVLDDYLISSNTTYLVLVPPFIKFTAMPDNVSNVLPYTFHDSSLNYNYYEASNNTIASFSPFSGAADNITFTPTSTFTMNELASYIPDSFDLVVRSSNVRIYEETYAATVYYGPVSDLDNNGNALQGLLEASADASNAYRIGFNQDGYVDYKLYFIISNAFLIDSSYILLDTGLKTRINAYSATPTMDNSGNYMVKLYKYCDDLNRAFDNQSTGDFELPNNYIQLSQHSIYHCDVSFSAVSFPTGSTAYTLQNIVSDSNNGGSLIDHLNNLQWTLDSSTNVFSYYNFEMVALCGDGATKILSLFDVNVNPTGAEPVAQITYITLPDVFNAVSADGSPVMRITYNGTMVAPLLSTNQITMNPQTVVESPSSINSEVNNYNILSSVTDVSGNF